MKKNLQLLLVMIVSILTSSLSSFAYDFEVDGIYYNIISALYRTCEVTAGDVKYEGDIVIPSSIVSKNDTVSVIGISKYAFENCSSLTSIEIPNSVTHIGSCAFKNCSSLTSIEIPNSVTSIENYTFYNCSSLTSIVIPNSVISIGDKAFYNCSSLTSIEIPNSVTTIGSDAFSNCTSLTSIEIPKSVTIIDAFENCSSLTSIHIPESVTNIGGFRGCSSLTSIEIPNSVTYIWGCAFYGCSSLTSIEIPNSVTYIGEGAFFGCSSLTSIEIPNSVTYIGNSAFAYCTSLSEIQLSKNLTRLDFGLFTDCTSLQSLTIPGSIRKIVFFYEESSNSLTPTFSSSIKSIRFDYSYESFEILYYLDPISQYYYTDWSDKTVSTFTNQIENLYIDRKFGKTSGLSFRSLKDLIIGEHIRNLQITGDIAPNLSTITCYATTPPTDVSFKQSQYTDIILKVPYEALEDYKKAEGWKNFWNIEGFDPAGADDVTTNILNLSSSCQEISRYNLNGQQVSEDYKGVVIVRLSDGTTKKFIQ